MLVGDSFTSSAKGTCGLQARHDSDGISVAHRGETTRQQIEQSISLGRVLQRFVYRRDDASLKVPISISGKCANRPGQAGRK